MKKLIIASLFFCGLMPTAHAQSTHDIMVGGAQDLIKTDNNKLFDKAQLGVEANYFIIRHFSVGAGAELWTNQKSSFVMGMRWYANDNFFVRFRGLIGENDASLGAGWSQPLNKDWRIEGMGDFYFKGDFALRAGFAYVIH
jgi:hypothetical protein